MNTGEIDQTTVKKHLIAHGIKPSVQRIAIMQYLLSHKTHPTVDVIYNDLAPSIPTLSKTTVYNTLKLFVEHNASLMLTIDEKTTHFDGDISEHAHFFCLECGCIYDIDMSGIHCSCPSSNDFSVTETHLYFKGFCKQCQPSEQ